MIYKIFPKDNSKLKRFALNRLIPNLLEDLSSISSIAAITPKEESKVNKSLKELLVIKYAIDFKINFHLATSSRGIFQSTKSLITEILPFAIQFHKKITEQGYHKLCEYA